MSFLCLASSIYHVDGLEALTELDVTAPLPHRCCPNRYLSLYIFYQCYSYVQTITLLTALLYQEVSIDLKSISFSLLVS